MNMVEVIVRQKEGGVVWRQSMDRDSARFRDFRVMIETELKRGWSLTIVPKEELVVM